MAWAGVHECSGYSWGASFHAYHTAIYQTQIIHMPRPALGEALGGVFLILRPAVPVTVMGLLEAPTRGRIAYNAHNAVPN